MKSRAGFVSNSSSSNFVLKKSEVDLNQLRKFLKDTDSIYFVLTDDPQYVEELPDIYPNGKEIADDYIVVSAMSCDENYLMDHSMLWLYMDKFGINEYTHEMGIYPGDGRRSEDQITEEIYNEAKKRFCKQQFN